VDERQVEALTYAFAKEWKGTISEMQGDIMKSFTNFMNGTAILQNALSLMVQYVSTLFDFIGNFLIFS
jgi:hypothetical protein